MDSKILLGLPDYEITQIERGKESLEIRAKYQGSVACPHCGGTKLRLKDSYQRRVRHESWGLRPCTLVLEGHKWKCCGCGRYFCQRFPGILPHQRATEAFRKTIFLRHWDGISRHRLSEREGIGDATVERHFEHGLKRYAAERSGAECPRILGIDEHFFSRRHGYATTFCDLKNHKIYDVVLGRSEGALEGYFQRLKGKDQVQVVCIDLSATYRAMIRRQFPNAVIVADRFHVIRLLNHHFLTVWKLLDASGASNRGLMSLMRRHACRLSEQQRLKLDQYLGSHPAIHAVYRFKQRLVHLLLNQHRTAKQCKQLVPRLLRAIADLRSSGFAALRTVGDTFHSWSDEIARMFRYTRNNGITEGFHTKMEVLQRQAYGFRNFNNYRLRVKVMCS